MKNGLTTIIRKLQHIGIPVADIAASETFYLRLGFENVMRSTFMVDGEKGTCIMLKNQDALIELYQMPEKQVKEIKRRGDGHIDHIAFDVEDINKTFDLLKEASFTILEERPVHLPSFWKNGCAYFNILGPDGERLEFNQIL